MTNPSDVIRNNHPLWQSRPRLWLLLFIILSLCWCHDLSTARASDPPPLQIAFFHSRTMNTAGPFWRSFTDFMDAAAQDLGVQIQYYYAENSPPSPFFSWPSSASF